MSCYWSIQSTPVTNLYRIIINHFFDYINLIIENFLIVYFSKVFSNISFQVLFSVENGKGEIFTKFEPPLKNQLCDGNWHTLKGNANTSNM